ncbi:hypothetical protein ABZ297_16465 [Nonomuraea sp. NPDC005983]|uniref:hypothetical protein n=1 Tax=Nonomuraea sp. NPDC005983 TaxID=3155595 RepID=UPI0033B183EA
MSKATTGASRARLWRIVAVAAIVVLAASLAAGLLWFFADPLHLPQVPEPVNLIKAVELG